MDLEREVSSDRQWFESNVLEATNKRKRAEDQASEAQRKAQAATEASVNVWKEKTISEHAFSGQLRDIRGQVEATQDANAALSVEIEQLRSDNEVHEEIIESLRKAQEDRMRPVLFRRRRAVEDIAGCSMKEADMVSKLSMEIAKLADEEAALLARKAEYKTEIAAIDGEIEHVLEMQQEALDAKFAAEGQAKALQQLILTPSSDIAVFTPRFSSSSRWSSRSPSASPEVCTPMSDEPDMIFDASFEESCGCVVESATMRVVGDGQRGFGLGLEIAL